MRSIEEIDAALTGADGAFAVEEAQVLGETLQVFSNRKRSLREVVEHSANHGDLEYLVCEGERISFRQHLQRVAAVARHLQTRHGVRAGDRVALLADNHPEWIISFWATVSIGGIVAAFNGWWSRDEICHGLADAEPVLLIGDRKRLARLEGEAIPCPVVCIEDDFSTLESGWDQPGSAVMPTCPIAEDDPALILYTSGTTGRAKGALLSHRCLVTLLTSALYNGARMKLMESESGAAGEASSLPNCSLVSAPLFHVSGLIGGVLLNLFAGTKTILTPGRFDPAKVLEIIETERVTAWGSLGSMAARVLEHPDFSRRDVSSINRIGTGGAPTSERMQQRIASGFSNARGRMGLGYGLTESSGVGTNNWGALLQSYPNSVGRVLPTIEITIRDADGRELGEGETGEIWIRGSCVMLEYWRNPEATSQALAPGRWLRTGDIGHFEGPMLYVNTRARDMILRNAENIYPTEIEHCLERYPGVVEAAVLGVPHEEMGQEVKAVVVVKPGSTPSVEELQAFCAEHLAAFKVPSLWAFRKEPLARNATGKILKDQLS